MTLAPIPPQRLSLSTWRLGSYHIACYLVRGATASALFESGISATAPLVLAQLNDLGIPREEIHYLVLSHAHSDHACGQAGLMAGLPAATLLMTKGSRKLLAKPDVAKRFTKDDAYASRQVMEREGFTFPGPIPACLPALPEPLEVVEPGQDIDLGGVSLDLLPAEGHAPHGLLGLVPEERVAFASDSAGYGTARGPAYPMCFVSFQAYLDTMRDLAQLEPEVLGLGHQLCLRGGQVGPYLEQTARRMTSDRDKIRQGCAQGAKPEELARRLFEKYYRHELTMFPPESALAGCRLLVRRCLED